MGVRVDDREAQVERVMMPFATMETFSVLLSDLALLSGSTVLYAATTARIEYNTVGKKKSRPRDCSVSYWRVCGSWSFLFSVRLTKLSRSRV